MYQLISALFDGLDAVLAGIGRVWRAFWRTVKRVVVDFRPVASRSEGIERERRRRRRGGRVLRLWDTLVCPRVFDPDPSWKEYRLTAVAALSVVLRALRRI